VLGDVLITPDGNDRSSFHLFCRAIGSPTLSGAATLGEVWAAVGMLPRVAGLGAEHPEAIRVDTRGDDRAYLKRSLATDLGATNEEAQTTLAMRLRGAYPSLPQDFVVEEFGSLDGDDPVVLISWRNEKGERRKLTEIAPPLLGESGGPVFSPALGTGDVLAPVAAWWVVALALSSVARYRPDLWRASLDRDRTPIATAVEEGLGATRELLPIIVMYALTGNGWGP
jgi:hypothetical protein